MMVPPNAHSIETAFILPLFFPPVNGKRARRGRAGASGKRVANTRGGGYGRPASALRITSWIISRWPLVEGAVGLGLQ